MKISAPFPIGYPFGSPFNPGGRISLPRALLIKMGGWGYKRKDSAKTFLRYGTFSISFNAATKQRRSYKVLVHV